MTMRRDCLITYPSRVSWRANCEPSRRNLWPYCQTEWGGPISPPGSPCSCRPIT